MFNKNILVIGGAGFVGSHTAKMLEIQGYRPIIFDNLSRGTRQSVEDRLLIVGDIADPKALDTLFQNYQIDVVMHFASFSDVGESMMDPAKYYINNVANTINLLEAMRRHRVHYFIFSSSAAIFGITTHVPIDEETPCHPINPYGTSKLMIENILHDYDLAYGLKSCCLRYFNAAGGDPEKRIKNYKKKENNLIPIVLRSLKTKGGSVKIFGTDYPTFDGTCIRDYIHIEDLGSAHILAMEKLIRDHTSARYNLGNGRGFSVREVLASIEKVTGFKVNAIECPRRPGDPPVLLANPQKALKELKWVPKYADLDTMILHAWEALDNHN